MYMFVYVRMYNYVYIYIYIYIYTLIWTPLGQKKVSEVFIRVSSFQGVLIRVVPLYAVYIPICMYMYSGSINRAIGVGVQPV